MDRKNNILEPISSQQFWLDHVNAQLPQFLQTNLLDEARIIKLLHHTQQSYIKLFIFELLKHCFESSEPEQESENTYLNTLMDLFEEKHQQIQVQQQIEGMKVKLSNEEIKKKFFEFLQMVSEEPLKIDQMLASYQTITKMFHRFFMLLLEEEDYQILEEDGNISKLRKLCEIFNLNYALYEECFQFTITEHYLYLQDPKFLYLVYIEGQKPDKFSEALSSSSIDSNKISLTSQENGENKNRETLSFNNVQVLFDRTMEQQSTPRKRETVNFNNEEILFDKTIGQQNRPPKIETLSFNNGEILFDKTMQSENYTSNIFRKTPKVFNHVETADTDFHNKSILSKVMEDSEDEKQNSFSSKNQNEHKIKWEQKYKNKCPNTYMNRCFEVSKQFTNTKIIEILNEPFRSAVRDIKAKAREERQICIQRNAQKRRKGVKSYFY